MKWHEDHWSKYQSTVEAVGGKLVTISSQQHTLRNPELTFQQGLVTRWNFLPKDWVCISDADNEVSKYYNMFLDVPLSTMNPGAENTYVGNKNGKMAQPGCVVLSGNISNNPGETLWRWAMEPSFRNLGGAAGRVRSSDVVANCLSWYHTIKSGKVYDGNFGVVDPDEQDDIIEKSMQERFPERIQKFIVKIGRAPKNWKIIPDEGRLDEDGKPMAARKLDSRAKLEQAGDAAAKGKSKL